MTDLRGGHRRAVGGSRGWDDVGLTFLRFLKSEGLQPPHRLLDVGCGCLRGAVKFIPYLDPGNYYGLEVSRWLLAAGIGQELAAAEIDADKRPTFVLASGFDVSAIGHAFDYIFVNSVFTHIPTDEAELAMSRLIPHLSPHGRLYATFYEGPRERVADWRGSLEFEQQGEAITPTNTWKREVVHTRDTIRAMITSAGGMPRRLGDWNPHRRDQKMWQVR